MHCKNTFLDFITIYYCYTIVVFGFSVYYFRVLFSLSHLFPKSNRNFGYLVQNFLLRKITTRACASSDHARVPKSYMRVRSVLLKMKSRPLRFENDNVAIIVVVTILYILQSEII